MSISITSKIDPSRPVYCLWFDDDFLSDYLYAWPILREYGIPGQSCLIMGNYDGGNTGYPILSVQATIDQYKEMVDSGMWQVCAHAYHHSRLCKIGDGGYADYTTMLSELTQAYDTIHDLFGDRLPEEVLSCIRFPSCTLDAEGARACWDAGFRWGGSTETGIGSLSAPYFCEHRQNMSLLSRFRIPSAAPPADLSTIVAGTRSVYEAESHWLIQFAHQIKPDGETLGASDKSVSQLRAWIEYCLDAGVQFVSISQFHELLFGTLWEPRHTFAGNLARNGNLRWAHLSYPSGDTMRPAQLWTRGGGTVDGHFVRTGGPLSRDDGNECGVLNCETLSGVWWIEHVLIPGSGKYRLNFKIKSGTGDKRFSVYNIQGKGGNAIDDQDGVGGTSYVQLYTSQDDTTYTTNSQYWTPDDEWQECTLYVLVTNPGVRRLRIVWAQETGGTAGTYHSLSDVGVYKV